MKTITKNYLTIEDRQSLGRANQAMVEAGMRDEFRIQMIAELTELRRYSPQTEVRGLVIPYRVPQS